MSGEQKILIVCHGKSEKILWEKTIQFFRRSVCFDAKDKGRLAIQVNGLEKYFTTGSFKSHSSLLNKYINLAQKQKKVTAEIFPIMDLDDCCSYAIKRYKNKEMFRKSLFYDKITPIFNQKNLEEVMKELGYSIGDRKKTEFYEDIVKGIIKDDNSFKPFYEKLKKSKNTNMEIIFDKIMELYEIDMFKTIE